MDYREAIHYLIDEVPMFQKVGKSAYKEGLENTYVLDERFSHPHRNYRTIHVAGTNGKGSCSHTLAAILQSAGYKVGLYTSPHLIDFRERIKVDGRMIPQDYVADFISRDIDLFKSLNPSFFELTTALAFKYFSDMKVDVAVIEVGMGGRLDCTNIITPDISIITNISLDHVQYLGNTLEKIAAEKAGIIKHGVPVVVGETVPETRPVFEQRAAEMNAPIVFAEDDPIVIGANRNADGYDYDCRVFGLLHGELGGDYQLKNTNTILATVLRLRQDGYNVTDEAVRSGFAHVVEETGFNGRWQVLSHSPLVICDAGHNVGGIGWVSRQLASLTYGHLYMVIGMVSDKDISGVIDLLPQDASYIFTRASVHRALDEHELMRIAAAKGLHGETAPDVPSAYRAAMSKARPDDVVFVGGSCFIVADLLSYLNKGGQK